MLRRVLALLILSLGVGGFLILKATRPRPEPVPPQERVWRVETAVVNPGAHRPELSLFGRVEAPDRIRAAAPVAGRLLEVRVRDGDRVAEGAHELGLQFKTIHHSCIKLNIQKPACIICEVLHLSSGAMIQISAMDDGGHFPASLAL